MCNLTKGGKSMLRKTLITVTAISALCIGSTAMAAHMGGGGGWGGGGGKMSAGRAPMMMNGAGSMGPTMRGGPMTAAPITRGGPMTTAPITGGSVQGWNGRTAWGHFHDHFHRRFHHRNFFAFGFGGPFYDYAYNSCWSWVATRHGWRQVYVCGGYPDY
jgi:hypothetical protein